MSPILVLVQGRPERLKVLGGRGIESLVGAVNLTYAHDREHRVSHHGADLLPRIGDHAGCGARPDTV